MRRSSTDVNLENSRHLHAMRLLTLMMAAAVAATSVPGSDAEISLGAQSGGIRHRCEQLDAGWLNVSSSSQCL